MAKFAKTIQALQELKHSQEGYLTKAKDKGNSDLIEVHRTRIKALVVAIKVLTRRRNVLLGETPAKS